MRIIFAVLMMTFFTASCADALVKIQRVENPSGACAQMDVKVCPDGSTLSRKGPSCEFPPCPDSKADAGVACTMDAKICPDGSAVSRQGPKCEFAPCPKAPADMEQGDYEDDAYEGKQ